MPKISRESTQPVPIDKNSAVVHTATVDVKIMRLGKRQVTLSVFRQMKEASILDLTEDDEQHVMLRGNMWGVVRYKWPGLPDWVNEHLVWSDAKSIYRMPIPKLESIELNSVFFVQCRDCGKEWQVWNSEGTECYDCYGGEVEERLAVSEVDYLDREYSEIKRIEDQVREEGIGQQIDIINHVYDATYGWDIIEQMLPEILQEGQRISKEHWSEIEAFLGSVGRMDQLFIAI